MESVDDEQHKITRGRPARLEHNPARKTSDGENKVLMFRVWPILSVTGKPYALWANGGSVTSGSRSTRCHGYVQYLTTRNPTARV